MAELTDAEYEAMLRRQYAMPIVGGTGGGGYPGSSTSTATGGVGGAGATVDYADLERRTLAQASGASLAPAVRARPKKCYYCGRWDGTHVGGCDIRMTDEEFRAAVREHTRIASRRA